MISSTFYPTPAKVARQMLGSLKLEDDDYILDPSAGKGDLLDVVKTHLERNRPAWVREAAPHLYAVEIEPELRGVLESKGYPVMGEDFLTYTPVIQYTAIVMNPPFDRAEAHVSKAWAILAPGGQLAAVLPTVSLTARTRTEAALCALVTDHGRRLDLGPAFASGEAERRTNVPVSIVWLRKPTAAEDLAFEIHNSASDAARPAYGPSAEVALTGFVDNLLAAYNAAVNTFAEYNHARQRLAVYLQAFPGGDPLKAADAQQSLVLRHNTFFSELQAGAWGAILEHPNFQALLTDRARKLMTTFRQRQGRVDFNQANIRAMFDSLLAKRQELLEAAISDAFDTMTAYHPSNRIHFEGWKSNKAWKVARRVVLPNFLSLFIGSFSLRYERVQELNDIDRALCIVAGEPYDNITTCAQALEAHFRTRGAERVVEARFFTIRYFIKGTIHLMWKDETLRQDFNLRAARMRGWLPPAPGQE